VREFVMNPITIRPATAADVPFLWAMLFESAFTTDEARAAWRSDLQRPQELVKYLDGWGRPGDAGVVAQDSGGTSVGAAWCRLFGASDRGDGILAQRNVPELAIAVAPEHRGRRIGEALLASLARRTRDGGYQRLMLSVDPANLRALRLYERAGFTLADTDDPARGTSLIMQLQL
jgi:ribosomal protein S18 acetylase RimI-like enzyme